MSKKTWQHYAIGFGIIVVMIVVCVGGIYMARLQHTPLEDTNTKKRIDGLEQRVKVLEGRQ